MTRFLARTSFVLAFGLSALAAKAADDRAVFFVEPRDGAVVPSEFKVVFGTRGWQVRPLGDMSPGTGHHHLLISAAPIEEGRPIPVDQPETIRHFGKGQTETTVKLPPGRYQLMLQLGDGAHVSLGEGARASIGVTVQ